MAAGNTYTPIATQSLSGSSEVTFSSIPAIYTDLRIVTAGAVNVGLHNWQLQFNGDTGANYSSTFIATTGGSGRIANATFITLDRYGYFSTSQTNILFDMMSYANVSANKTLLSRSNNAAEGSGFVTGLWRNTAAVTSIRMYLSGSTFASGSTASLYGIAAA